MRIRFTMPAKARLVVAGFALMSAVLAGCGSDDGDNGATSDQTFNSADVEFAQGMIPHHAQAIDMAELVPDRSEMAEVQSLAQDIEAAQQPEIDQMSGMLEEWDEDVPDADAGGHADHGSADGMEGMMSDDDMAALGAATGAEFDRMWLNMMIEHHEGAISMSQSVLDDGVNPEVAELAEEIIEAQQAEIDQMRQLLDEVPS
jgi:uncharacterized protein (DUF305 family)